MKRLEKNIAQQLKTYIGKGVTSLEGNIGKARIFFKFETILYRVKENNCKKIIIEFNELFKENLGKESNMYKKAKKFCEENNYSLNFKERVPCNFSQVLKNQITTILKNNLYVIIP